MMCWREDVCSHLQAAIAELECAVAEMPASYERLLLTRALRTCGLSLSECARNLDRLAVRRGVGQAERLREVRS
jgi:hypothetical protein